MLQIERKKPGERNIYTLLNRYMGFINKKAEYPQKQIKEIANNLEFTPQYYYSIISEMRSRNLLEDYSEGPFRVNVSSNGNHTPILESEDLFQYADSLELFEARFHLCLQNIEKAYKEKNYLKALWRASKSLYIFDYGQDYRYRFVLYHAPKVFANLTNFSDSTLPRVYRSVKNAISQKAKYNSIPNYIKPFDFHNRLLFYEDGEWFIDVEHIREINYEGVNDFWRRYKEAPHKQIANQDQVEEFLN